MLRHQTVVHGRPKKGPFGHHNTTPFLFSIADLSNTHVDNGGTSDLNLPKTLQSGHITDTTEASLHSSDFSTSFTEHISDSELKPEVDDDDDTVTLFLNQED